MRKLFLSIPILLLSLPLPLSAQNRECPPQGYYGAMSQVCPPPPTDPLPLWQGKDRYLYTERQRQLLDQTASELQNERIQNERTQRLLRESALIERRRR